MSAVQKQPVRVDIGGRAYHLGGADPERTRALARKVDEAINRCVDSLGAGTDRYQLAILAALQIADELAAARDEHQRYRLEIGAACRNLLDDLDSALDGIESDVAALGTRVAAPQRD